LGESHPRTFLAASEVDELQLSVLDQAARLVLGNAKLARRPFQVKELRFWGGLQNCASLRSTHPHKGCASLVKHLDLDTEKLRPFFARHGGDGWVTHRIPVRAPPIRTDLLFVALSVWTSFIAIPALTTPLMALVISTYLKDCALRVMWPPPRSLLTQNKLR
jgi:hypothetical protein